MAKGNTIGDALTPEQKASLEPTYEKRVDDGRPNRKLSFRYQKVENKIDGIPESALKFPEHFVKIAMILKNNAEIRRFTSLGIINYLKQKGIINQDAKTHVDFKWNKFAVSAEGLTTEYSYKQTFFINCLVSSFTSFANSAQQTISDFVEKELPDYEVPTDSE